MFTQDGHFAPPVNPTGVLVDVTGITDGDSIVWESSKGRFTPRTPSATTVYTNTTLVGDGTIGNELGLAPSGVTPGAYTNISAYVDTYGRITTAVSGSAGLTSVAHDATMIGDGSVGNPLSVVSAPISTTSNLSGLGTIASPLDLSTVATITPGAYPLANVTVDSKGRVSTISSGGVSTTSNLTGDGSTLSPLDLSTTAATPGSYTNSNITVDNKGRITAVSNGAGGISAVSVVAGDLVGNGTGGSPLGLATYGAAGTWYAPKVVTDTKGRSTYTGAVGFGQGTSGELDAMVYNAGMNISNAAVTDINYTTATGSFPTLLPTLNKLSTTNGRFTVQGGAQSAGMYIVTATVSYNNNATGYRQVQIAINGLLSPGWQVVAENVNTNVGGAFRTAVSATYVGYLDIGAQVVARAYQNSGGTLSCLSYFTCSFLHN